MATRRTGYMIDDSNDEGFQPEGPEGSFGSLDAQTPQQFGYATDMGLIVRDPSEPATGATGTDENGVPFVGEAGNTERPREFMPGAALPQRPEGSGSYDTGEHYSGTPSQPREPQAGSSSLSTFTPMAPTFGSDVTRRLTTSMPAGIKSSVFNASPSSHLLGRAGGKLGGGLHVPGILGEQDNIMSALYQLLTGQSQS